jgi:hypothetical protein
MLRFDCTCRVHLTYSLCINPWPPPPPPTSLHVLLWPSIVRRAVGGSKCQWPRHGLPLGALPHRHTPLRLASLALPPCHHRNSDSAGSGTAPTGFWQRLSCSQKWCVSVGWARLCECASSVTEEKGHGWWSAFRVTMWLSV